MEGMVCGFCSFREQPSPKHFRNKEAMGYCCPEYLVGGQRQNLLEKSCEKFRMRKSGQASRMWQMTQALIQQRRNQHADPRNRGGLHPTG